MPAGPLIALRDTLKPVPSHTPTPPVAPNRLTVPGMPDYDQVLAQKKAIMDQVTAKDRTYSPMTPLPVKALLEIISGGK